MQPEKIIFEIDTEFEHYQVIDMVYVGRSARVLFSGIRSAAQSAIPRDHKHTMMFDYNQRFLELVEYLKPKNLLLIGGGAYTLPMKILEKFSSINIDVVERDPQLKLIAERFFGLQPNKRLRTIFDDGREYLNTTQKTYDLILVDAFTGNKIPHFLSTIEFAELLKQRLTKSGTTAINIISSYHGPNNTTLKQQYATYKHVFRHVNIHPADTTLSFWISQNFIQISTSKIRKPKYSLRFEPLKPPITNSDEIAHD